MPEEKGIAQREVQGASIAIARDEYDTKRAQTKQLCHSVEISKAG